MLHIAEPFLEQNLHPTVIVLGFMRALEDAIATVDALAFPIDTSNREQMLKTVQSCIGTKYTARFGTLMAVCCTAARACHSSDLGLRLQQVGCKAALLSAGACT